MDDLTEDGGDVLHSWIDECETKIVKHTRKSSQQQTLSISMRSLLVIVALTAGFVALVRAYMMGSKIEFFYAVTLLAEACIVLVIVASAAIDKSTFNLRIMHELTFMKFKCRFYLMQRQSPEKLREEYHALMTKSNKVLMKFG